MHYLLRCCTLDSVADGFKELHIWEDWEDFSTPPTLALCDVCRNIPPVAKALSRRILIFAIAPLLDALSSCTQQNALYK